jgi:hypothetical protein
MRTSVTGVRYTMMISVRLNDVTPAILSSAPSVRNALVAGRR